jgi:hypothetical protein
MLRLAAFTVRAEHMPPGIPWMYCRGHVEKIIRAMHVFHGIPAETDAGGYVRCARTWLPNGDVRVQVR